MAKKKTRRSPGFRTIINIEQIIVNSRAVKTVEAWSKRITLPGFEKVPLYDVVSFFFQQINKVGLSERAAAIAFNLLMAVPAALIFLFTLIPYMPVSQQITRELLSLVEDFAPNESTYLLIRNFLVDFLNTPRSGLLSLGFVLAIYYSSNATLGLMRSFNRSLLNVQKTGFFEERLKAIKYTTVFLLLMIITLALLVTQGEIFQFLMKYWNIENPVIKWLISSIRWVLIILIALLSVGLVYKYVPAIPKRWKIASPGAILTTFLIMIFFFGFSFWVKNFNSYNKIYGSIGTILILMLLIYSSAQILLIGYELNVSIHSLKAMAEERQKHEEEQNL